jgi:hypothetical protein
MYWRLGLVDKLRLCTYVMNITFGCSADRLSTVEVDRDSLMTLVLTEQSKDFSFTLFPELYTWKL